MAAVSEAATMLSSVPFFASLDGKRRKALASDGKELLYKAGDPVVGEGASGVGFYLILDGHVEVRKGNRILASLGKGEFFGEMSLIDDQPRSADVIAVTQARCWALSSWSFKALVKANPDIALVMLKELVKRLRAADSSLID
ncbi:MAG TPA: cyclic nucleotide-binding domain-containing protein [Nitrososphaerales archaeon]|nr:cyclic nucleotide-binding domain-containing protein [Nitrososphaerales archaeon]